MSHVKSVIFDLDGTLHDRAAGLIRFAEDQFDRLGLNAVQRSGYVKRFQELDANGMVWKDKVYSVLVDEFELRNDISVDDLVIDYIDHFPRFAIEMVGASAMISSLRSKGIKLAILSNGKVDLQKSVIRALGIYDHVDAIVVSEEVGFKKPDKEIFEITLDKLSVRSGEAIMVGDSYEADVVGAQTAGITPILLGQSPANSNILSAGSLKDVMGLVLERFSNTQK